MLFRRASLMLWCADARPKLNAIANQAMGKGSERVVRYPFECSLEFANIDNIHVMRQSLVKLAEACSLSLQGEQDWGSWMGMLMSSGWLTHVWRVMAAALKVARYVGLDNHSVTLHWYVCARNGCALRPTDAWRVAVQMGGTAQRNCPR